MISGDSNKKQRDGITKKFNAENAVSNFILNRKPILNIIKLTLARRFMSIVVPSFVGVELFEAVSTSVRHYVLIWNILNDQMMGE